MKNRNSAYLPAVVVLVALAAGTPNIMLRNRYSAEFEPGVYDHHGRI